MRPQAPVELRLSDGYCENLVVVNHPLPADRGQRRQIGKFLDRVAANKRRQVLHLRLQERWQVRNDTTDGDHRDVWQVAASDQCLEFAECPVREWSKRQVEF